MRRRPSQTAPRQAAPERKPCDLRLKDGAAVPDFYPCPCWPPWPTEVGEAGGSPRTEQGPAQVSRIACDCRAQDLCSHLGAASWTKGLGPRAAPNKAKPQTPHRGNRQQSRHQPPINKTRLRSSVAFLGCVQGLHRCARMKSKPHFVSKGPCDQTKEPSNPSEEPARRPAKKARPIQEQHEGSAEGANAAPVFL